MLKENRKQIKSYEDLEVYQESFELAMEIHKITLTFPKHELYELGSQLRRSSKSIPANIAEGWSKTHTPQYLESLNIAQAELRETKVHLKFAYRLKYITKEKYIDLISRYNQLARKLKNLEKSLLKKTPKPKTQNLKPKMRGFTLIEMLMSLFILLILISAVSGIYLYSIRAQKKTMSMNLIGQEIQFVMDSLSKRIRSSEIDYNYYKGTVDSEGEDELALYNKEDNKGMVYKKIENGVAVCFCDGHCNSDEDCNSDEVFKSLTTKKLKITDLKFYINPSEEPFGSEDPTIQLLQPRVTIRMKVEGAGTELNIQQTVPQRFFERR